DAAVPPSALGGPPSAAGAPGSGAGAPACGAGAPGSDGDPQPEAMTTTAATKRKVSPPRGRRHRETSVSGDKSAHVGSLKRETAKRPSARNSCVFFAPRERIHARKLLPRATTTAGHGN